MKQASKTVAIFLLLIAGVLQGLQSASAHASLVVSEPTDGAVVQTPPRQMKLKFSEVVSPLVLRLLLPDGRIVRLSEFRREGDALLVDVPPDMRPGTSILSWRVASQDGHPVGGTLTFAISNSESKSNRPAQSAEVQINRFPLWGAHYINLVLLTLTVGGCLFHVWITPLSRRWRSSILILGCCGVASACAVFLIELADTVVGDTGDFRNVYLWLAPVASTLGVSLASAIVAYLFAIMGAYQAGRAAEAMSFLALVAAALVFTASGHAATASPQILMRPAIFSHLAVIIFWAGSLVPLIVLGRGGGAAARRAYERFSTPILVAVIVLLGSGTVLAVVQLNTIDELWNSGYGVVLSLKLSALVPLFALAAFNRFYVAPRVKAQQSGALRLMGRTIASEIVLVLVIFGLASLWRFTPPPREMAAITVLSTGIQFHAHGTRGMANLVVSPARTGPVNISINVMDVQSRPLLIKGLDIVLLDPRSTLEPIRRAAHPVTSATWQVDPVTIPTPGAWLVRVEMLVSDFDKVSIRATLNISDARGT